MKYSEFKDKVTDLLQKHYGDKAEVKISECIKNNDTQLDGVSVIRKGSGNVVSPVVYLNDIYEKYEDGQFKDLCDVVRYISDQIQNHVKEGKSFAGIVDNIGNWGYVSERIFPRLVSAKLNQENLKTLVFTPFLDLAVIYVIDLTTDYNSSQSCIRVNHDLMRQWSVTVEELHEKALENLRSKVSMYLENMGSLLSRLAGDDFPVDCFDNSMPEMTVLSNEAKLFGASELLNLDQLPERYADRSFYVLPSSVHEVILVPDSPDIDKDNLDQMVREVNSTSLVAEEVLSDHAYYYAGGELMLQCA